MNYLTIGIENTKGGCGWVKIIKANLTRANIEDLVDVVSEYEKIINDFLFNEKSFPVFSEFLQTITRRLGDVEVQPDLNLEHFSDNDVKDIFCDFFKKNEGPVGVSIFVGNGNGICVSSEGSVERIAQSVRKTRMTR